MMKLIGIIFCLIWSCGERIAAEPQIGILENAPTLDEKARKAALIFIVEKLNVNQLSTDAAWEVFSAFVGEGESVRDKAMIFVNILHNNQAPITKRTGYFIRPNGPFIRDCSTALSISREALLKHFATKMADDSHQEECVLLDARKLFMSFGTEELERLIDKKLESVPSNNTTTPESNKTAEQAGAGQPATKPADKPPAKDQPSPPTPKDGSR